MSSALRVSKWCPCGSRRISQKPRTTEQMKRVSIGLCKTTTGLSVAVCALLLGLAVEAAAGQEKREVIVTGKIAGEDSDQPSAKPLSKQKKIVIETIEHENRKRTAKEVAWLGLSTEEASEALASQLGLSSGEGLVVNYVAPDSPAAKAGFRKNDVLVELDDQLLVHPAQFRKLVQMHKEGDTVRLAIYRGGKKQSISVTLGKTIASRVLLQDDNLLEGNLRELKRELGDLHIGESVREQLKELQEDLSRSGPDKEKLNLEIKRSIEQTRQAIQGALRSLTNTNLRVGPFVKELDDLARAGVVVGKGATVVVKNDSKSVKTMVKNDETGTYVIVATPNKRLTAHDKDGKLLFDGDIETPEQQQKVPGEVWEKVKPMLEQMGPVHDEQPEAENGEQGKSAL